MANPINPKQIDPMKWEMNVKIAAQMMVLHKILDLVLSQDGTNMAEVMDEIRLAAADSLGVCPNCGNQWAIHDTDGGCTRQPFSFNPPLVAKFDGPTRQAQLDVMERVLANGFCIVETDALDAIHSDDDAWEHGNLDCCPEKVLETIEDREDTDATANNA